ncbi:MAG TPA: nuclear transport factor 2 family protein [Candidatus Limnocylindrales bacterium]|nr:nuclear transport factor 2 family protein [Candidatus Limnocylindrales bacterium]
MDDIASYANYAAAFERAYASDNWDEVREYFAEEAVYEVNGGAPFGGVWKGRDVIVNHLMESVNQFDRTYDKRELSVLSGPEMRNGGVHVGWTATYKREGKPDLVVVGEEEAWFRDGKIIHLRDTMPS